MSAYNSPGNSGFVTASELSNPDDRGRTCPSCGKQYDEDGRARAAYLRHVSACQDDEQTTLNEWIHTSEIEEATDEEVRRAIEGADA